MLIVGKNLADSNVQQIKEIIASHKDCDRIYVITRNVSLNLASYLRNLGAIVIDNIYFEREDDAIRIFSREYGLKEINSL